MATKPDRDYVRRQVNYDESAVDKVFEAVEYLQTTGEHRGETQKIFNWRDKNGITQTIVVHSDGQVHVRT